MRNPSLSATLLVPFAATLYLVALLSVGQAQTTAGAPAEPTAAPAVEAPPPPPPVILKTEPVSTADGETSFRRYCASCHGKAGKGDGPLAGSLRQAPADLSTLAARKGGFVAKDVAAMIEGSRAHGEDMPKWGEAFAYGEASADRQQEVDRKIAELVAYLETLQSKH